MSRRWPSRYMYCPTGTHKKRIYSDMFLICESRSSSTLASSKRCETSRRRRADRPGRAGPGRAVGAAATVGHVPRRGACGWMPDSSSWSLDVQPPCWWIGLSRWSFWLRPTSNKGATMLFLCLSFCEQDYCNRNQPKPLKFGVMTELTSRKNLLTFGGDPDTDFGSFFNFPYHRGIGLSRV